jgi:hypothetical protein
MSNGSDAVAALSMDGVRIGHNNTIFVRLRSDNWVDEFMQHLNSLFEAETSVNEQALNNLAALNLNLDGSFIIFIFELK